MNSLVLQQINTMEASADTELLRLAAQGDRSSFDRLYAQHHRAVFGFAWRFTRSNSAAEDITQDAFVSLLLNARAFRPERSTLRNWLLGIARNLALKRMRKLHPEMPLDVEAEVISRSPNPLAELLSDEIGVAVTAAVSELPLLQRETLILFEYEGLALAEIAAITGADLAAVKSRLYRARERLRVLLAPLHGAAKENAKS